MRNLYLALCSTILLLAQAFQAQARQLNLEEAVARMNKSAVAKSRRFSAEKLTLAYTAEVAHTNCFYVVNREANNGFMLLSADDCAPAVLGYVDQGQFDANNIPANMAYFIGLYKQQIYAATRANARVVAYAPEGYGFIPTLVEARWNQGGPYNRLCTDFTVLKDPVVTGCVATAMSQIMRHYRWPVRGKGKHSYTLTREINGTNYTVHPSADFNVEYDWDNMLFDYNNGYTNEQGNAVALLMRHAGVSVDMGYSPSGSGAYSGNAINALRTYFGYDKNMRQDFLADHTDESFTHLLLEELSEGRPMLASGNGHAFICDGYDGEGYFHWNWGWGGSNDGYFMLAGRDAVGGFRDGLTVIRGIQPDRGQAAPCVMSLESYALTEDTITNYAQDIEFQGWMLNRSMRNIKVMQGVKFVNEKGSWIAPGLCTVLKNNTGFKTFRFRCQNIPNGTYKVYPAYRDLETGDWHFPSSKPQGGVPTVTINVPEIEIHDAADLVAYRQMIANGIQGTAIFKADIDLGEICGQDKGSWVPIGNREQPFRGRVLGNGHRIHNLYINSSEDFQGLFGAVGEGSYIEGITLSSSCEVRGGRYVAGIAGGSSRGGFVTIRNCGNEGLVNARTMNGAAIIGCCYGGGARFIIQNCYNTGRIFGSTENAAICGYAGEYLQLENCYNTMRVSGHDGVQPFARFGNHTWIDNCYQQSNLFPKQRDVKSVIMKDVKNGKLTYLLNGMTNGDTWYQQLDTTQTEDLHPVLAKGSPWVYALADGTFSNQPDDLVKIEDAKAFECDSAGMRNQVRYARGFVQTEAWETLFVPFASTLQQWGSGVAVAEIKAVHHYDDNGDGAIDRIDMDAYTLRAEDSIKANTPYLIKAAVADSVKLVLHRPWLESTVDFEPAWCANNFVKFAFHGTYDAYTTTNRDYVIKDNLLQTAQGEELLPQRWYIRPEYHAAAPNIQKIRLRINGNTATGIVGVGADADGHDTVFDLLGRPVNSSSKGIHIRRGHKVLVR